MKAVILAAGKGERLSEVTQKIPKPMIPYKGKPILEHNIELCKRWGIQEIYINTHHLPEKIQQYFGDGSDFGVSIFYSYEESLLGTAGAVKKFETQLGHAPFFVLYGDNYSNYDLNSLKRKSEETSSIAIIGFHWREYTAESGVAEFDSDGRIVKFIEKPKPSESDSHWVNAGMYYLQPDILEFIRDGFFDFSRNVFPSLLAQGKPIYGVCSKIEVKAFDTPDMYKNSLRDSSC